MSGEKAPNGQRILAGILFMCGAGLLFPVMGGFKWIRNWLPYRLGGEALERSASAS